MISQLKPALSGFRDPDEVLQRVRHRLLVAQGGRPKLHEYGGRGSLSKWAQREGLTKDPVDFAKLTWPNGLRTIDAKLAEPPPPPC